MANQEHLDILRQGVEVWHKWRKEHADIQSNFRAVDLSGAYLSGAYLGGANFSYVDFRETDLSYADLSGADLSGADLSGANLSQANLIRADLSGAYLSGAYLSEIDHWGARLDAAYLSNTNLWRADLSSADLRDVDLSQANLDGANLSRADLSDANLDGANLDGANLSNADLRGANLSGADLSRADLSRADLSDTNLDGANLDEANLSSTNLNSVNLSHAKVGWTTFVDLDLRPAKGLETVVHRGPSSIGIDTILKSEGDIPESFLRGAGLDDTFITYIHFLIGKPIEYYSCFISHSSKDQEFAERLHADLQNNNVRCWYAPHDMKTGDRIRPRIYEQIWFNDKLLLVLSESSVASEWVDYEVETALARERKEKRDILFPIRVDDAVKESTAAWAAHIQEARHITDFTRWKEHDEYQKGLNRLLRDLKQDAATENTSMNLAKE